MRWVVIRSVLKKDATLIANLELKRKSSRSSANVTVTAPQNVRARHGNDTGTIILSTGKVPKARIYYVGICQGDPSQESSWTIRGPFDCCRSIELEGLNPGEVYYFRVRCFGAGEMSPWSAIVSLRVL